MGSSMPVKNVMIRTGSAETAAMRSVSGKTRNSVETTLPNSLKNVTMEARKMVMVAIVSVD
ncbi:hypothetical protein AUJ46_04560 [Candidatus Peregrinibacteria bacterium CG1_02_54_53]|nr:MAG: hypothetical protein AUJ46_04560 [Candidatus Peregrinibacteria bacterium CG1_02_54_53]